MASLQYDDKKLASIIETNEKILLTLNEIIARLTDGADLSSIGSATDTTPVNVTINPYNYVATSSKLGFVMVDNETIKIDSDGKIYVNTQNSYNTPDNVEVIDYDDEEIENTGNTEDDEVFVI